MIVSKIPSEAYNPCSYYCQTKNAQVLRHEEKVASVNTFC